MEFPVLPDFPGVSWSEPYRGLDPHIRKLIISLPNQAGPRRELALQLRELKKLNRAAARKNCLHWAPFHHQLLATLHAQAMKPGNMAKLLRLHGRKLQ